MRTDQVWEATLPQRCRSCGGLQSCRAWEALVQDRLQWTILGSCPACGDGEEEFGWDESPPSVRSALIQQCGLFRLRLQATPELPRVSLMAALRKDGTTLADVPALAERLVRTGVTGTEIEMRLLELRLNAVGAQATVSRDGAASVAAAG
ncbi:hypothetical protein I0C86_37010 [Plantactinospora sp. S1510]|uniref:DUF1062 domain-containing protein n=1 Tax=Plantactinospora alkalitolerans TaxID=2789879 RepID=A0ABS0H873_9ACTN|nr:hypothetical protein [Plantactinospora alkalitolerans]MBF9134491.1 hypothetical protein [Plantactinospora alkalitolerans]